MIKQRKTSESSQDSVETDNLLPRNEDYLEQKATNINLKAKPSKEDLVENRNEKIR